MATRLFIGNLPRQVSDAELEGLFAEFGTVQSVEIMRDRETGHGKGFGLVEMGVFLFVLVLGLVYAWRKGVLRWV